MNSEKRNIIVGQSGGPTAAINSSLAGVYRSAKERGYKKVYGMVHGVQGLMKGHYIDLSEHIQSGLDEELLKRTPAAYLGSCRFQLPEIHEDKEVFDKIFGILDDLEIDCFIYIGGNDSMDTIKKLSDYGMLTGSKVRFVGCPKTIDNDLALTDHTPGYGSAAKYIGTSVKEIIRDGMSIMTAHGTVTVVEIMGRNAGWLTGAACLAEGEDCQGPDAIYLPEIAFDVDKFVAKCESLLKEKNSVVVCVSEGIHDKDGKFICEYGTTVGTDSFGHKMLEKCSDQLVKMIRERLGIKARAVEFNVSQRCSAAMMSGTDQKDTVRSGIFGVRSILQGETGKMVSFVRKETADGSCYMDCALEDVNLICNQEKAVPREWINADGTDVGPEFIRYAAPLIQGIVEIPQGDDGLPAFVYRK